MASKYQSDIDRIKARLAGNNSAQQNDVGSSKTSKYQSDIDRIKAQISAKQTARENHTADDSESSSHQNNSDRLNALFNRSKAVDDQAKDNTKTVTFRMQLRPDSTDTVGQINYWLAQMKAKEAEESRQRGKNTSGMVNANNTTTFLPSHMPDARTQLSAKTIPQVPVPVYDAGDDADSNTVAGTLVQIQGLQSDIKKAEEDQKRVYKAANEKVAMLEYEMSILSPSSATESDFLNAEQKIEDAKKARDAIPGDYDKKISALQDEIFSLYGSLSDRYDFSEKSKYDSTRQKDENGNFVEPKKNIGANAFGQPVMFYGDGNTGYDDIDYDFINRDETARRRVLNDGISLEHDGYKNLERDEMTDDEIGVFNYLYSTAGPDAAYDFVDYITGELNARQRARLTEEQNEYAKKDPVGASVESIVTSPLKAVTAFNQLLDYADDRKIDQNAAYNRFSFLPTATRATVSGMIEKNWGPVGSGAYNIGMSIFDNLANTAAGMGNPTFALAIMSSGVAADTVISAKDRGLSDNQAVALGAVAAVAEALTEKVQFDELFKVLDFGKGEVAKYIFKNMKTEGFEEGASSLANFFADVLISGDKSEWNQKIQYYMSKEGGGLSKNQAFGKAFWEQLGTLGEDVLGGMISGGVLGGGSAAIQGAVNYASTPSVVRQMNKGIKHEATQRKLLDSLINASDDKKTNAAAKLVNTTAKYAGKGVNAVNATLEFIRSEASAVYNQIRAIDEAGASSTLDKQESTQAKRAELQTRLDTLVATDEMIRRNREEIEAARKRKENVEYVDPGEFDADGTMSEEDVPDTNEDVLDADTANVNGETAQSDVATKNTESDSYNRYAQSAVKEALETAEVSVTAASRDLLRAYDGDMRAAVDALRLTEREIRNGNSRFTKSDINSLRAMDETLRRYNADFIAGAAENLRKSLAKYGVTNVVVGGAEFVGYKNVRNKANYNRETGVLTVSPYLNTQEVIAASVAHEFTHHGAKYDLSLVNDAISLLNGSRDKLGLSSGELLYENYEATYREEAAGFMRSAKGQALVKQYMDNGKSAAEAQAQVIKDYINEELAADFLGYLLSQDSNSRVFKTFSGENRTLLRRILDAITGFIRRLRGENADADVRQYERAAELLRDILNKGTGAETTVKETNANAGKKTETDAGDDVRKSKDVGNAITVDDIAVLRTISQKSVNEFTSEEIAKTKKWAKKFYHELGVKSPFFRAWFGDWRASDSSPVTVVKYSGKEYKSGRSHNTDMERDISWGGDMKRETINHAVKDKVSVIALGDIGDVVRNAIYFDSVVSKDTSKTKMPNTAFMHSLYSIYNVDGKTYLIKLFVEEALSNNENYVFSRAYQLKDIQKIADITNGVHSENGGLTDVTSTTKYSIADLFELVKRYDSSFNPKLASMVVNKDGTPKVMYHGTNTEFTVFDRTKGTKKIHLNVLGDGNYFTAKEDGAKRYGGNVMAVYLDIKNPYIFRSSEYNTAADQIADEFGIERSSFKGSDVSGILKQRGYDGVVLTDGNGDVVMANAFDSTQIKSATDNRGTFDGNNPDIRYAKDVADVRSTEEKLRAENEYLKRQFMSRNGDEWAKAVSPEDVRRVSREIAKDLPGVTAGAVEAEFAEVVKVLQRRLTKDYSANARYRDAMEAAKAAAAKLIMQTDKVTVNNEWLDIRDLKKKLRDTKVYVSESVTSEMPEWQSVRRELSGALSVVTTDRTALPLDSFYSELAEEYPEYFPPEIRIPQQQMERVIKVARELKEIRQYNHETLWVDAEDTGDTISAEMANSDLVQSFANVILAKYNESAMETLAAQLRREKDSQRWDSNSTRNMLAELQREIPLAQENAKQTIERHMRATRQKVNQFMALYNEQMDALKAETEQANADAEWLRNRLSHQDERTKITTQRKRYSRNLKTLYNLLTKPTDKRHIPEGLQRAVIDLLSNFSGVKLDNGQTIDPEVLRNLKGRFSMENGADAVGALERMVKVVRLNKTSADFSVSDGFIDDLQKTIDLAKEILNEPKDLSKGELQDQIDYYAAYGQNYFAQRELEYLSQVNRVLSMVQKYINDSNKVFLGGKREYAADMADQVAYEMRNRPKRSNVPDNALLAANNRPKEFSYDHMQADTFWHMFGDFGDMIMKSYRKAQNYQMEHEAEYADWMKKNIFDVFKNGKGKKYNTHDLGWGGELVTVSADGKKFEITRAQLMSCYVTWNQPEGKTHMTNGGVFFKNQEGEEVDSRHVVFTDESFAKLMEKLSEQDKAICDKVVKFLSIRGATWGNEASMYLYGYKKFTRDYYFPIMAAKSALPVNWDQMTEYSKLEYQGMTKARRGDAKNAIMIDNFFDVADSHIRNMAAYSAFAPLNNDVRRIFDMGKAQSAVKLVLGDKTTGGKNKKMGGWGYLVDFLQNVDKNKVMAAEQLSSSKALRILSSMYKRQAVSSSLSSATKQPISYVRAWNVLDGKYLTMAFADKSFVPGSSEYKRIMKDMVDHSGVAKMKLLGYSDTGSAKSLRAVYDSNYSMLGDEFTNAFARNAVKGYEKISDFFMIAAETMDKWTWIRLWKACELEVDAKNKGLSRYERTEAVAELFNQVIGETQVVDTVLDSTPALRNSDGLAQQMYAFMKEPIKTVNTVFRAWDDVKTGRKGAKKAMTKALVTFAVSNMILEPLISALFGMLRDEEDEEGIFLQKLGNSMFGIPMNGEKFNLLDVLTSESVSSIYNTIPIVEEFADVLFSRLQGYDIERMDVTGLAKTIDAVVALWEYDSKKTKTFGNTVSDVVTSFAGLFGLPAYTLKRDVSAAFRLWYQWTDDYEAQWDLNKRFYNLNSGSARSQKNFYDIISHVIREGDEDAYQYIREDLSNVFTSDRKGLSANDMLKYMESRKVEFDYTSRLWNIELQANFDLPQFVSNMKVEPLITDVYRKTGDSSVLPSPPSDNFKVKADAKFSDKLVWNSEKDADEDSRTVTFETQADLAEYTEKVGDYRYKTLLCFVNSDVYKNLNYDQKVYAINKAYDFAVAKYKTELYPDYDPNNDDFAKHIKWNSNPSQVAQMILSNARRYKKK